MFFALPINEVMPPGEGRDAFLARFLMATLVSKPLEIMAKLIIANQVLTLFALFVVGMVTHF
jgi:ABC-type multidrug transport system permease subunit